MNTLDAKIQEIFETVRDTPRPKWNELSTSEKADLTWDLMHQNDVLNYLLLELSILLKQIYDGVPQGASPAEIAMRAARQRTTSQIKEILQRGAQIVASNRETIRILSGVLNP